MRADNIKIERTKHVSWNMMKWLVVFWGGRREGLGVENVLGKNWYLNDTSSPSSFINDDSDL